MWDILGAVAACSAMAFCFGHWIGRRHEAMDWRDKAKESTAYCSDGSFFYVRSEHDYVEMNNASARCRQYERGQPVRLRA